MAAPESRTQAAEEEGTEPVVVVAAVSVVADMATVSGMTTTTTTMTAHTSSVLAATLTSGLIRQTTALDRSTSGDKEDGMAAIILMDGSLGIDRVIIIHNGSSGYRHKVCRNTMC